MNLQSATIAGSGNPLKYRFECKIRAKIVSKSADPFAYSPPSFENRFLLVICRGYSSIGGDRNIKKESPRASLHSWSVALPLETAGFPAGKLQDETTASLIKPFFSGAQIQKEIPLTFRYEFSHLYSFSKPHFISKNASMATFETTLHPQNAIQLVLA